MRTLLAIDVGNTRVKGAWFEDGHPVRKVVLKTRRDALACDYEAELRAAFPGGVRPDRCLVASVVRGLAGRLQAAVRAVWAVEALEANARMDLGISIAVPRPEGVGIDRLLEAGEAFRLVGGPVVVAALGSAVTVDLVTGDGAFRGGTILPGLRMGLQMLHAQTSLLPDVVLDAPASVLGTDTESCMRAGVVYGAAGAVDRICRDLSALADGPTALVLTGGDADVIAPFLHAPFRSEPDLVLRGLASLDARLMGA